MMLFFGKEFVVHNSAVLSLLLKDDNNFIFLMNSSFECERYLITFVVISLQSRAINSVYVSVLKIQIVLADGVGKWLRQNFLLFFFARGALVSAGKNIIFRYNNGYKQRLYPLVAKRRQFSDLFSWARVLINEAEKELYKRWKRKLGISAVTIRFTVRE